MVSVAKPVLSYSQAVIAPVAYDPYRNCRCIMWMYEFVEGLNLMEYWSALKFRAEGAQLK